jgi:hypothetical protein
LFCLRRTCKAGTEPFATLRRNRLSELPRFFPARASEDPISKVPLQKFGPLSNYFQDSAALSKVSVRKMSLQRNVSRGKTLSEDQKQFGFESCCIKEGQMRRPKAQVHRQIFAANKNQLNMRTIQYQMKLNRFLNTWEILNPNRIFSFQFKNRFPGKMYRFRPLLKTPIS